MKRLLGILLMAGLMLSVCSAAQARKTRDLTYRYSQLWSSTIRFIRVDSHYPITEKDKKSGYVLFDYKDSGRSLQASVEFVPVVRDGKKYVRLAMSIEGMPSYVEGMVLDKLMRKLKREYGEAPAARIVVKPTEPKKGKDSSGKGSDENTGKLVDDEDDLDVDDDELEESVED